MAGQLEYLSVFVRPPAEAIEQAEVFAELDPEPLGGGEIIRESAGIHGNPPLSRVAKNGAGSLPKSA